MWTQTPIQTVQFTPNSSENFWMQVFYPMLHEYRYEYWIQYVNTTILEKCKIWIRQYILNKKIYLYMIMNISDNLNQISNIYNNYSNIYLRYDRLSIG